MIKHLVRRIESRFSAFMVAGFFLVQLVPIRPKYLLYFTVFSTVLAVGVSAQRPIRVSWPLLVFMGYALPSILFGAGFCDQVFSIRGCGYSNLAFASWCTGLAFILLGPCVRFETSVFFGLVWLMVVALFIALAAQIYSGEYVTTIGEDGRYRLSTGILRWINPNNLATVMVFVVVAALCAKWVLLASVTAVLVGLSHSYAVMAALLLAVIVVLIAERNRAAILIAISLAAGFSGALFLSETREVKSASANARIGIYSGYIDKWRERPIFGHGFGTVVPVKATSANDEKRTYYFAHSVILHTLVQGGLVGLALFLAAAGWLMRRALIYCKRGNAFPLAIGMAMIVIGAVQKGPIFQWPGASTLLVFAPIIVILWLDYHSKASERPPGRTVYVAP